MQNDLLTIKQKIPQIPKEFNKSLFNTYQSNEMDFKSSNDHNLAKNDDDLDQN